MHLKRISGLPLLAEILQKPSDTTELLQEIPEITRKLQKCLREPPKNSEISPKTAGNLRNLSENHRKCPKSCRKPAECLRRQAHAPNRRKTNRCGGLAKRTQLNMQRHSKNTARSGLRFVLYSQSRKRPSAFKSSCAKRNKRAYQ